MFLCRLTTRTRLFWTNLLLVLMVGGIGAQVLSSHSIFAQEFTEGEVFVPGDSGGASFPEDAATDGGTGGGGVSLSEICGDQIDNDGDQQMDEFDPEGCVPADGGGPLAVDGSSSDAGNFTGDGNGAELTPTPGVDETLQDICANGLDDNFNELIDEEPCIPQPEGVQGGEEVGGGVDSSGAADTFTGNNSGGSMEPTPTPTPTLGVGITAQEICGDFTDNDGDDQMDEFDPDGCVPADGGSGASDSEVAISEGTELTPTPIPGVGTTEQETSGVSLSEICGDGIDNDGDQQMDEFDPDGCVPADGGALGVQGSAEPSPTSDATPVPTPTPEDGQASSATSFSVDLQYYCSPSSATLKIEAKGPAVTNLQKILMDLGYDVGSKGADGDFGDRPQAAVTKFQQDKGLEKLDGEVGPETWGALCAAVYPTSPLPSEAISPTPDVTPTPNATVITPITPTESRSEERVVPNSYIVSLRQDEVGTLNEIIETIKIDLEAAGGWVAQVYGPLGMFNIRFNGPQADYEQFLETLKANPAVERISKDGIYTPQQGKSTQKKPTGVDRVDGDLSVTKSGNGRGAVNADIAIIDTGVQVNHPDLNVPVSHCLTFIVPRVNPYDVPRPLVPGCNDPIGPKPSIPGHGTLVAGVAAAKDNNVGTVGTTPGARIWALKVCEAQATVWECPFSAIAGAYIYVLEHANEIDVVNISLGDPAGSNFAEEKKFIEDLISKGVVVVVAAGNENWDVKGMQPGGIPAAITVSAITDTDGKCGGNGDAITDSGVSNPDDFISSQSNFGSGVDFAAPGTYIYSTMMNSR